MRRSLALGLGVNDNDYDFIFVGRIGVQWVRWPCKRAQRHRPRFKQPSRKSKPWLVISTGCTAQIATVTRLRVALGQRCQTLEGSLNA